MEQAQEPVGGQVEPRKTFVETSPRIPPGFILAIVDGVLKYDGRFEQIPQMILSNGGALLIMHPTLKTRIDQRIARKAGNA